MSVPPLMGHITWIWIGYWIFFMVGFGWLVGGDAICRRLDS